MTSSKLGSSGPHLLNTIVFAGSLGRLNRNSPLDGGPVVRDDLVALAIKAGTLVGCRAVESQSGIVWE